MGGGVLFKPVICRYQNFSFDLWELNLSISSYGTRVDYIYCNEAALALWQCTSLTNIGNFSVKGSDAGSHSGLRAVFHRNEGSMIGPVVPVKPLEELFIIAKPSVKALEKEHPVTILNEQVGHGLVFEKTESEEEPKIITMTVTIKGKTFSGSCPLAWDKNKGEKEGKKRAAAAAVAELYGVS